MLVLSSPILLFRSVSGWSQFAMLYLATCDFRDMRLPRVEDNVAINSSLIGSYGFVEDVRIGLWSGVKYHLMC